MPAEEEGAGAAQGLSLLLQPWWDLSSAVLGLPEGRGWSRAEHGAGAAGIAAEQVLPGLTEVSVAFSAAPGAGQCRLAAPGVRPEVATRSATARSEPRGSGAACGGAARAGVRLPSAETKAGESGHLHGYQGTLFPRRDQGRCQGRTAGEALIKGADMKGGDMR